MHRTQNNNEILEPNDPKKIGIDGIERLCQDLELDPVSKSTIFQPNS